MSQLYASLFYQKDVTDIFSDSSLVTYMIQVEVALAQAQAQVGVIPQKAANTIAQVAEHALDKFDFSALAVATGLAGNIAIPFVKQLTAIVKDIDEDASRYVHWGATSQDILDTACILQCCDALNIVEAQLQQCYSTALEQAKQYRHQVMIGRTWLQQALPITLGHKLARWASAFKRDLDRIQAMKSRVLTAQLGGAVGSLASLQDQGSLVVSAFAKQLNLTVPTSTWHGERDRIVEIASVLGMIVGNTGKMARDWSLMMQTEIAELFEPTAKGRGGSSTMPHKRNPVAAASVLAAANRVPALMSSIYQSMVQEHERSLGAWHAEWLAVPEIFQLCAGALSRTGEVLQGFEVNAKHMQQNLECTSGLIMAEAVMMALAPKIGRLNAHHLVEAACKTAVAQNQHLFDVVSQLDEVKGQFSQEEIRNIFKPENYLGNIQQQIDAVLKEAQGEPK
ncbi:3-carboxy-cis,cis-muconate cycloisomerase [Acinetobacter baumannii]|uniref:3-carboxy-cis,cis-muconate cycloisomerase n=1 Tax=Acinetobacter baumannii TaxID=470 RepID=UPI0002BC5C16|nr:3-carboxy-cis,cis-muconate cycloisomerase [Acinetobacter baumannii]ANS21336.1 3-carboxy-cis,cis-muconate cycloisomerase [Acinetobacter baumannii PR07]AUT37599.1 3-carboxy-cis,cis-muconate cycloisomerase [Acinetobacter baumannii]EXC02919.1 3-carboxy-cis,cis-muconate cycloisomerase [Acinetobacter baumannii 4749]EXC05697.1 3-carboxy-cis,cis-muconate cycloisomerase [Acinetobacter baumannii 4749]EXC10051.1 3-carboxy-cis,cis-muconate cycloisomerase [Acinetobacter baumannii 4749]